MAALRRRELGGAGQGVLADGGRRGSAAVAGGFGLVFDDVTVAFKGGAHAASRPAVEGVSFQVPGNGFTAVVGPSGCGKSTLLNVAAGLLEPAGGCAYRNGELVNGVDRRVGYVAQDANLLPWLTVVDNVALPLKLAGVGKGETERRARHWLRMMGLDDFRRYYPGQLSGGMQKRCSIARTFVYGPQLLLMDEPFGSLDAMTRLVLQQELLDLWEQEKKTVLFVTHDLGEAIALSDTVIVMTKGPGRIKKSVPVPLPRPRDISQIPHAPEFVSIHSELGELLRDELAAFRLQSQAEALPGAGVPGRDR